LMLFFMSACMMQKKLSARNPGNRLLEVSLPSLVLVET
jgi:hypothetical protein